MEHTDAVRLQAVEKYVLGELSPALQTEFESHYFDCHECALGLRAGVAFAAASRQFFAEVPAPAPAPKPAPTPWFAWLKPMIAVPVFAALLLVVGYQNLVTIPRLAQPNATVATAVDPWFSLANSNVHGSAGQRIEVRPGQEFHLFVDVTATPKQPDSVFLLRVQDASGKVFLARTASAVEAQRPVLLSFSSGLHEGEYKVVITEPASGSATPVGVLPFTVAFSGQILQH